MKKKISILFFTLGMSLFANTETLKPQKTEVEIKPKEMTDVGVYKSINIDSKNLDSGVTDTRKMISEENK